MKVGVGSKSKLKIAAVRDTIALYPKLFPNPEVEGIAVDIEEFGHPKNIQETMQGAVDRAKQAFEGYDFSFGLEAGLMEVPYTMTGYMETSACAVFDGVDIYVGLAPSFEWPKKVTEMIFEGGVDASAAFKKLGLTAEKKLGAMDGGISGFLSDGKAPREDFLKNSILMALIRLEQADLYKRAS